MGGGKLWSVVRMDTNDSITHSAQNGSTITHYGVKGMKWGVRKEYEPVGRKRLLVLETILDMTNAILRLEKNTDIIESLGIRTVQRNLR